MKRLFLKLSIFGSGILVLNAIVYFSITRPLWLKFYIDFHTQFDTVILADSHGIPLSPNLLAPIGVYNASSAGDNYVDMYLKVRILLENNHVQTLILTVDDHTLSPYRETKNNLPLSIHFYADASSYADFYPISYYSFLYYRFGHCYFPIFDTENSQVVCKFIQSRFSGEPLPNADTDWSLLSASTRSSECLTRREQQFPDVAPSIALKKCLLRIVTLCAEQKVRLIGIRFPLSAEYLRVIGDRSFQAAVYLKNLNIAIADFRNIFVAQDSYFYDEDHLNAVGAKQFCYYLNEFLTKYD